MPDWQTILALALVAAALTYLGARAWRWRRGNRSGCTGCAPKSAPPGEGTFIPTDALVVRRRETDHSA